MADPRIKQIKIKTGVVKRLTKERLSYEKEAEQEQARYDKMKDDGKDEYVLRKQQEVIGESKAMVPDTKARLIRAYDDLKKTIDGEADLSECEEYKEALKHLQEAKLGIDA